MKLLTVSEFFAKADRIYCEMMATGDPLLTKFGYVVQLLKNEEHTLALCLAHCYGLSQFLIDEIRLTFDFLEVV